VLIAAFFVDAHENEVGAKETRYHDQKNKSKGKTAHVSLSHARMFPRGAFLNQFQLEEPR